MTAPLLNIEGAEMIVSERIRQITVERHTPDRDAAYTDGELLNAAWAYLTEAMPHDHAHCPQEPPVAWPWPAEAWKPSADPIRNLVKAGALIAAEIDRLAAAGPADVPPPTLISGGGTQPAGGGS